MVTEDIWATHQQWFSREKNASNTKSIQTYKRRVMTQKDWNVSIYKACYLPGKTDREQ